MQTIGERFEEARKKKGISIREAAEATKIRGDYLQKFEGNHFDIGLTEIYTRGFLRNYATFLKLPSERILSDYSALGRGEPRPRQPSREVYGRMDISVAKAGEASERAAPPEDEPAATEPARAQPRYPRGGSSLPQGPDPAVVFKYVKWAGIGAVVLIAVLILKSLFSGGDKPAPATARQETAAPAPVMQPAEPTFNLVALDAVYVEVIQKNADESDGKLLFKGNLSRGQTQSVPKPGPVYITPSAAENLVIEINGQRYPTGRKGYVKMQLQ